MGPIRVSSYSFYVLWFTCYGKCFPHISGDSCFSVQTQDTEQPQETWFDQVEEIFFVISTAKGKQLTLASSLRKLGKFYSVISHVLTHEAVICPWESKSSVFFFFPHSRLIPEGGTSFYLVSFHKEDNIPLNV